jgi:hypothetical protein
MVKANIACVNYDYRQQFSHFFSPALRHTQLDCDFLERIFDEDHHSHATYINNSVPLQDPDKSFVIEQNAARRKECGNRASYYGTPYSRRVG